MMEPHELVADNIRLMQLLREVAKNAPSNSQCECFHHRFKDRLHGADCPCVERWEKTLQKVQEATDA